MTPPNGNATAAIDDGIATANNASSIKSENPLLRPWSDQSFHLPPFQYIRAEHFAPAFEVAMSAHLADLEAIASSSSNDFDSILGAYDRAGGLLSKVSAVYGNYISSLNTPDMQIVQTKMAPILSRHTSKTYDIPGLFEKIEIMHEMRCDKAKRGEWTSEQERLAERVSQHHQLDIRMYIEC